MATAAAVVAAMQKTMGKDIGSIGTALHEAEHLPSGVFNFDLATAGGWVKHRINEVFGPESSGKSTLCYKTMATTQKLDPKKKVVFIAIEPFDSQWAAAHGVDLKSLVLMQPYFANQAVDMVEGFICADDVSLVVLDSIGAMINENELNAEAGKEFPGGNAKLVGKMMRKVTARQAEMDHKGGAPTLICTNQIRFKIGVSVHQNPEDTPGGKIAKHAANFRVRLSGVDTVIKAVNENLPAIRSVDFRVKKRKCPLLSLSGKYEMVMIPHDGLQIGDCNDSHTVITYMKKCGLLEQTKTGWKVLDETFKKQEDIKAKLYTDKVWGQGIRDRIFKTMLSGGEVVPPGPETQENGE